MINKYNKFWFKLADDLIWKKKPTKLYSKNNLNNYSWFPDGLLSVYENTVHKNLDNKNSIITVDLDYKIRTYTYKELRELVNSFVFLNSKISKVKHPKNINSFFSINIFCLIYA